MSRIAHSYETFKMFKFLQRFCENLGRLKREIVKIENFVNLAGIYVAKYYKDRKICSQDLSSSRLPLAPGNRKKTDPGNEVDVVDVYSVRVQGCNT